MGTSDGHRRQNWVWYMGPSDTEQVPYIMAGHGTGALYTNGYIFGSQTCVSFDRNIIFCCNLSGKEPYKQGKLDNLLVRRVGLVHPGSAVFPIYITATIPWPASDASSKL